MRCIRSPATTRYVLAVPLLIRVRGARARRRVFVRYVSSVIPVSNIYNGRSPRKSLNTPTAPTSSMLQPVASPMRLSLASIISSTPTQKRSVCPPFTVRNSFYIRIARPLIVVRCSSASPRLGFPALNLVAPTAEFTYGWRIIAVASKASLSSKLHPLGGGTGFGFGILLLERLDRLRQEVEARILRILAFPSR
jgi:hypothetical protein